MAEIGCRSHAVKFYYFYFATAFEFIRFYKARDRRFAAFIFVRQWPRMRRYPENAGGVSTFSGSDELICSLPASCFQHGPIEWRSDDVDTTNCDCLPVPACSRRMRQHRARHETGWRANQQCPGQRNPPHSGSQRELKAIWRMPAAVPRRFRQASTVAKSVSPRRRQLVFAPRGNTCNLRTLPSINAA